MHSGPEKDDVVTMLPTDARAWIDVDLAALVANARELASRVQKPLVPMVKANAYGMGAVEAARALDAIDPHAFGVAEPWEAEQLRAAGVQRPIISFTALLPRWIPAIRALDVRPTIADAAALRAWLEAGGGAYHLELDTGMSRGGMRWDDSDALSEVASQLDARCEGLFSHCHSSESDAESVQLQHDRLQAVARSLPMRPSYVHLANSAISMQAPHLAGDLARPGIYLYGGGIFGADGRQRPRAVASVQGRVVGLRTVRAGGTVSYGATWTALRDTRVATVALGYADGVPRSLSNRGMLELAGRVVPVVGRVTMDMIMLAVPDNLTVAPDDVARYIGGTLTLEAQAAAAGTISYELLTSLGARLPRRYGSA